MRVLPMLLLLTACGGEDGPDLPVGWEEAELLVDFGQSACAGDPTEGARDVEINGAINSGAIRITWTNAVFRCEQDVEAYIRREGTTIDLLVQPVEILPEEVARCDCYYDLDAGFNVADDLSAITFYTRRDEVGGPSSPNRVGTLTVQ